MKRMVFSKIPKRRKKGYDMLQPALYPSLMEGPFANSKVLAGFGFLLRVVPASSAWPLVLLLQ